MKLTLLLCGIHSVTLVIFHIFFWKIFNWKKDLANLTVANRAIIQILNLRLIYVFICIAGLCFFFPQELATTTLGKAILIGMSIFWLGRAIEQFIFLPYNTLFIHFLSFWFLVGFILFGLGAYL